MIRRTVRGGKKMFIMVRRRRVIITIGGSKAQEDVESWRRGRGGL